ncbi:MAG TPA: hypothetical protein VLF66_08940 [Thermoanaerobaculia bacterium]|nr:hypothetical protein [Thermoanaerobaculia bacterium]
MTGPPYVDVVYLAPTIEQSAWDVAVAIVAHELAHLVLDHVSLSNHSSYDEQEEQVFAQLCEWGFEVEAKKHQAVCRWRVAMKARMLERYSEDMRRVGEKYQALAEGNDR